MNRPDLFTSIIVIVCLAALGFLTFKTCSLKKAGMEGSSDLKETLKDMGLTDEVETKTETEETKGEADEKEEKAKSDIDYSEKVEEEAKDQKTTQKTEVEKPSKKTQKLTPPKPQGVPKGKYMVIAGSFKQMQNAENEKKRFIKLGYTNANVEKIAGKVNAYLVADRFASKAKADALVADLKSKGMDSYVRIGN